MRLKEYLDKNIIDKKKFCKRAGINARTLDNMIRGKDIYLSIAFKVYDATGGIVAPFDLRPEISASEKIRKAHLGKKRVPKNSSKDITEQQQQQKAEGVHGDTVELPPLSLFGAGGDQLPPSSIHLSAIMEQAEGRNDLSVQVHSANGLPNAETEVLRSPDPIG